MIATARPEAGSAPLQDDPAASPAPEFHEPAAPGVYRDRDGDIWVRVPHGWVLCLQGGVAVDIVTVWQWTDGHVRDYAPFALVAA